MANQVTNSKPKFSVAIQSDAYKNLINNTLGDKEVARRFVADISSVVSTNPNIATCDAGSIISAGLSAQSLNLPLSQSLGFAYIVPFGGKAQFQVGYKGLVQMCQRSGLFEKIGVRPVHEGEYIGQDEFGEDEFKFDHKFDNEKVVGYYAYFKLLNGFKKTLYWTNEQIQAHGKKYSQTFKKGFGLWVDQYDTMAQKTVLKTLLSKYAPMSVDIQNAIKFDQAVFNSDNSYTYADNIPEEENKKTSVTNNIMDEEVVEDTGEVKATTNDDDKFGDLFDDIKE